MIEKLRTYAEITEFLSIARRYFVNNFYDGMLTILGILLGFFILIFKEGQQTVDSHIVLLTGLATSISMLMSGLSGSYISEKAEQKRLKSELDKAMVIMKEEEKKEADDKLLKDKEIEKAMLTVNFNDENRITIQNLKKSNKSRKKSKTLQEKAERFASIVVSLVNGFAPLLGGIIPLIPFFFTIKATFNFFILSFIIVFICIVLLGIFVGFISRESLWKNVLQMLVAFGLTIIVSILLLD
ncbi:MAG: VIT1/CCC1 transporter family protein [Candidatus Lokiarchaeota archaeon]|nr:VIT1/CCC1 transporter family protein [Candidatus Lokiarchaeota archaeon]